MGTLTYINNFFKDRYVASLVPTFSWAIRSACSNIDFTRDLIIVEYGAGTGVFTEYLLSQMTSGSKLVAIERNEGMFKVLSQRISDPRLLLHNDSAERVNEILVGNALSQADYIISGIPFSLFPAELTKTIVAATCRALKADGTFLVYQCLWTNKRQSIIAELENGFAELKTQSVPFNFPPLAVFHANGPRCGSS